MKKLRDDKETWNEYQARWRKEHPESVKKTKKVSAAKSYLKHKEHINKKNAQWYGANKEHALEINRAWRLKKQYNISSEEWQEMFDAQEGRCLVCGKHQSEIGRTLHIHHDHESGQVIGLLCSQDNQALGMLEHSVERIKLLLKFAEKHHG